LETNSYKQQLLLHFFTKKIELVKVKHTEVTLVWHGLLWRQSLCER